MTTPSNDEATASKQTGRPSLYTENVSKPKAGKQESILSSLEPEYAKVWSYRHARLIVLSALLFGAMAYWAWQTQSGNAHHTTPQWVDGVFSRIAALQEPHAAPAPVSVPDAPLVQALPPPPETQVAVIINEPSQGRDAETTRLAISEMLAKSDTEKVALSQEDLAAAKTSTSASVPQKETPEEKPAPAAVVVKPVKHKNLHIASNASSQKQAKSSKTSKSGKVAAGKDADVDLIAALLTRVSSTDAPVKDGSAVVKTKSGSANVKREGRTQPNRDIVQRDPTESTAVLVKRCRALGFFEGELCRNRICSQRWGSDPACPGPVAATSPLVN